MNFLLLFYLLACCSSVISQDDCSGVTCPAMDACPDGTEAVLLNKTNNGDIYNECCEAFECRPIGCNLGLLQLDHGESFDVDTCTTCVCNKGALNCTQKECPKLQCRFREYEGYLDGACCKSCLPRAGPDPIPNLCPMGRHFINPSNPCLSCVCSRGRVSCIDTSAACPALSNCSNVVRKDGQCCSVCNDTKGEAKEAGAIPPAECSTRSGVKHQNGESWSESSCQNCTCASGKITCTEEVCPNITCNFNEVKKIPLGKCCPYCASRLVIDPPPRGCQKEGLISDPSDPCRKCYCYNGRKSCISEVCPAIPASCKQVEKVAGQCCPVCQSESSTRDSDAGSANVTTNSKDTAASTDVDDATTTPPTAPDLVVISEVYTEPSESNICEFRGRKLQHRERFSTGPCSMCICLQGFVACTQHQCPQTECSPLQKLVYFPDRCCPECVGPESSMLDHQFDSFTGAIPPLQDLTLASQKVDNVFTQAPPAEETDHKKVIDVDTGDPDESLENIVKEEFQKVVDKLSHKIEAQDTVNNEKLQADPAKSQEIAGSKTYWIVGAGLGVVFLLVTISAISLTIIYHYRRKAMKQSTVTETI